MQNLQEPHQVLMVKTGATSPSAGIPFWNKLRGFPSLPALKGNYFTSASLTWGQGNTQFQLPPSLNLKNTLRVGGGVMALASRFRQGASQAPLVACVVQVALPCSKTNDFPGHSAQTSPQHASLVPRRTKPIWLEEPKYRTSSAQVTWVTIHGHHGLSA